MLSPSPAMMSPTALSSTPFDVESGRIQTQDSIDEKHQPELWMKTEEQELDPKPSRFGIKRYHFDFYFWLFDFKRPKFQLDSSNTLAYNHQNNDTVIAIKKWYQIRGWSLLYPLVRVLF